MPTSENIITTVEELLGIQDNNANRLKISAILNQILSYLNRDNITEEMIPVVCSVIVECISKGNSGNVQSLSEGDRSITFSSPSPFFGKLDGFKLIRGIL